MRSKVVRRGLSVLSVGVVVALAACSSTSTQVSDQIASQVKDKLDLSTEPTVTCPDDAKAAEGESFTCQIEVDDGTIPVKVTFQDDTNFTSKVDGAVYEKTKLDDALTTKLTDAGVSVTSFDCDGGKVVIIKTGATISCVVTGPGGGTADVTVGLDDNGDAIMVGSLYAKETLDAGIAQQLNSNDLAVTSVDCGEDELIAANEDTTIECQATDADGATATVTVELGADSNASIQDVTAN